MCKIDDPERGQHVQGEYFLILDFKLLKMH